VSRRRPSAPIWAQPAPGTRQPRFSREQIARVALAIADKEGFAAVSMRRIADEIGAGTMTLYHYVRTRADLMALVDDALMGEVVVPGPLPPDWRDALSLIAHRSRDTFLRHPWALHALQGARFGPNGLRHAEQSMAAVAGYPGSLKSQMELLWLVDDFVFGHALRAAEASGGGGPFGGDNRDLVGFLQEQFATGGYPHLQAMAAKSPRAALERVGRWLSDGARFERGLRLLLDGAERAASKQQRTVRGPPRGRRARP
jgi:AcrR family transcriptional regulator